MEQEQMINKFTSAGQTTLRGIFQALAALTNEGTRAVAKTVAEHMNHRLGEQQLYSLMATSDAKDVVALPAVFNEAANLNKMREYLNQKGVTFAFEQNKERTNLFFRQVDSKVVERALADLTEDIYSKNTAQDLTKKPEQTAAEFVKNHQTKNSKAAGFTKSAGKAMTRK